MSRYYFHFHDIEAHWDTEGVEMSSATQASEEAVKLLGELMRERPCALLKDHGWRMEVEDHHGSTVYVISAFARPSMSMSQ